MSSRGVLPILLLLISLPIVASDVDKERRWADQIVDALIDGEPIWLKSDDGEFLGIYTKAEDDAPKHALIIAHGTGVHPDWDQVIKPMRVEMPLRGWSTLSIQMPILRNDATSQEYWPLFEEVAPRINAAIEYLHSQEITTIVIAAHSRGASMSAYYLANDSNSPVDGFVAVGMGADQQNTQVNAARSLEKIGIPVLDIYGSDDLPAVLDTVTARAQAAATAGNKHYEQALVSDANHFFDGKEEQLLQAIESWLKNIERI